jgi:hypothetical protein
MIRRTKEGREWGGTKKSRLKREQNELENKDYTHGFCNHLTKCLSVPFFCPSSWVTTFRGLTSLPGPD